MKVENYKKSHQMMAFCYAITWAATDTIIDPINIQRPKDRIRPITPINIFTLLIDFFHNIIFTILYFLLCNS